MKIEKLGYAPVECDEPLPCPFCGEAAELAQLAHTTRLEGKGRKKRYVQTVIIASTGTIVADTFWFKCSGCKATTGGIHTTPGVAVEVWNRRAWRGDA